jgi:hypothetical protein
MRLRFTIRDLLWLTLVVAMAVGWWIDRRNVVDEMRQLVSLYERQPKLLRERDRLQALANGWSLNTQITTYAHQDFQNQLSKAEAALRDAQSALQANQEAISTLQSKIKAR